MDAQEMFNNLSAQNQSKMTGSTSSAPSTGNPQMAAKLVEGGGKAVSAAGKAMNSSALQGAGKAAQSAGTSLAGLFKFYGGETVSQLKSAIKVNVIGNPNGLITSEDSKFYKNVSIPKKRV